MHERKRHQFEELLKLISDRNPADAGQAAQGSDPSTSLGAGSTKAE